MKPKHIAGLFLLAVVLAVALFLYNSKKSEKKANEPILNEAGTNGNPSGAGLQKQARTQQSAKASNIASETPFEPRSEIPPEKALNAWSNQVHRPIEFYGKVIDERGGPIEGANIAFMWGQFLPESSFETNTTSDTAGLFSLTNVKGAFLDVRIEKEGYYASKTNQTRFQYWAVAGSDPFQPDKNNPKLFLLHKKNSAPELLSGKLTVRMPIDGTPISVDFFKQSFGAEGPLKMSQVKPLYENWKQANEWSFRMEIPGGGLVEEHEEYPYQAPESGYISPVDFRFRKGESNWLEDFRKQYYFKFGTPPVYGHVVVETDISWSNARVTYSLNPSGSRNLEPK